MTSDDFFNSALCGYASSIRAGEAPLYESLCFFQNSFRYHGEDRDELIHRAAMALICHDPLFLMTSPHGSRLDGFSEADVSQCVESWSLDDECLAAMCEGYLRMAAAPRDEQDSFRIKKAREVLERAKTQYGKDQQFLRIYAEALRVLDDERSGDAFDDLLENTEPEWRAHHLRGEMDYAVAKDAWERYDELRSHWAEMPNNAHICECAINFVANIDGLRCLERGDEKGAICLLEKALSVPGCPHLNTGAGSLRLANALLDREIAKTEVAEHLVALEEYCESTETAALRKRLE